MFIKAMSKTLQESTSVDMKNSRFLAYLTDGSTDTGMREQEIAYCRYVKEGSPVTKFLDIQHLEHAHADDQEISSFLNKMFRKFGSLKNFFLACFKRSRSINRDLQEIVLLPYSRKSLPNLMIRMLQLPKATLRT